MNKWVEILAGLILLLGAIIIGWYSEQWFGAFWDFKAAAWLVLKGGVFWGVFFVGLLFLLLGLSDLKG